MGSPPRAYHNHSVRPSPCSGEIHLPHFPQHRPIPPGRSDRLHLSVDLNASVHLHAIGISLALHLTPVDPRCRDLIPRLAIRLCLPRAHRLHHIYPRQILQAAPRHVPAPHDFPQTLPILQIPRGGPSHRGRRDFHLAPPILQEKGLFLVVPHSFLLLLGPFPPEH